MTELVSAKRRTNEQSLDLTDTLARERPQSDASGRLPRNGCVQQCAAGARVRSRQLPPFGIGKSQVWRQAVAIASEEFANVVEFFSGAYFLDFYGKRHNGNSSHQDSAVHVQDF